MGQIESKATGKAVGKATGKAVGKATGNAGKAANKATASTSVAPASTSVDAPIAYKNSNAYKRQVATNLAWKAFENNLKKNPPTDLTAGDGSALKSCMYAGDDVEGIECGYVVSDFLTSPTGCGNPKYRKNYSNACKVADEYGAPAKTRADFLAMQRCYADPKKPECARWAQWVQTGCDEAPEQFGCPTYSPAHGAVLQGPGDRGPFKIPTTNWKNTRNLSDVPRYWG